MPSKNKPSTKKTQSAPTPKLQKASPDVGKKAGRPTLPPDYAKASLTLKLSDILWMDRLCSDIREQTGEVLDRGSLLRGMISAIQDSEIDLRKCKTEKEIVDSIAKKLKS